MHTMSLATAFMFLIFCHTVSSILLENIGHDDHVITRNELDQEIKGLKTIIAELNDTIVKERNRSNVAFVAELSRSITNPTSNFHIVFDNVKLNAGNAYHPTHGIFVAPYPGIYHFAVEITAPPTSDPHSMHVRIMKKTQAVAITFLDNNMSYHLRRTGSIVLQLNTGDDVWCQTEYMGGQNTITGGNTYSMFSGFIIHLCKIK
ncbi:complement C1q-like protein 4 [Saccostrea cucullata]|uniref:complement C1q-like protein 4 n=1 Tax=Saccostrea cuccullata TaxID=36930 RepID=UPI002ED0ED58